MIQFRFRYKVKDNTGRDGGTSEQQYYRALQLAAFEAVNCVCRIPTHLFTFVEYCELIAKATGVKENSSGWGRGMRATIGNWYKSKDPSLLAMHITKYPQRGGWSHRDLLRLAHPRVDPERDFDRSELLRYAVKGEISLKRRREGEDSEGMTEEEPPSKALLLVNAVLDVKKLALETDEQKAVELIAKFGLVREHLPPDFLNSVPVWRALLQKMPMTAMIRNLAKMTVIGLLADGAGEVNNVVAKLTDPEQLKAARIHPMSVLMASTTYTAGHGDKGKLQWTPVVAITKALDEAFYLSFKYYY
uniref:TROVE domain-containing protein n=1 Tax=Plectus sambesii TaxID=2011161 RepID=A0A914VLM2_9BILA